MFEVKFSVACLFLVLGCTHLLLATATKETHDGSIVDSDFERLKSQFLPASYANTNFTLEDVKKLLRQKCAKAGIDNTDFYKELEQAAGHLWHCANSIANLTEVMTEIEEARPAGELDVVFHKYCARRPRAERCLQEFNAQLLPCLTPAERAQNAVLMRTISSLLGFICYKDGDQIALFIAEEGPECIEANKDNIANCMNATFAAYWPEQGGASALFANMGDLSDLVLGPKQCIDLHDFEECVLSYLEQCNVITPANIIESMFKYVKNETKCQTEIDKAIEAKRTAAGIKTNGENRFVAVTKRTITFGVTTVIMWGNRRRV